MAHPMEEKMKKFIIGIFTIITLILSGCGNSGEAGDGENEIVFWNSFTGADNENMVTLIEEYNATDPEYPVKNVSMQETDMYQRIPTVVNSGSGVPDLNIIHAERVAQYRDSELLEPIDDYLKDYPEIHSENYIPEAWDVGELDGTRYAVPLDIHTWGTYYNPALVEKYAPGVLDDGIVTFEEIFEVSEKAKEDGITTLGMSWTKPNFLANFAQFGGKLTEDGTTPTLNTQAAVDTFQLYADLYEEGALNVEGSDPMQLFLTNELIFLPEGIWAQNDLNDTDFDYGLVHGPQVSDDISEVVNWSSSHQFVLFKNEERDEAKTQGVFDFIDWVRENSLEWARAGQIVASTELLDNEEYQQMPQAFFVQDEANMETLSIFDYKYNGYVSQWLDSNSNSNVFDVIYGRVTPEEAAESMQKFVGDYVEAVQ